MRKKSDNINKTFTCKVSDEMLEALEIRRQYLDKREPSTIHSLADAARHAFLSTGYEKNRNKRDPNSDI